MLKGYFIRKPRNVDEVKAIIPEGHRQHAKPVEIESLGRVVLTLDEYIYFCNHLYEDYDFLKPYADESVFTEEGARCVLVGAPGQHVIAICLEGFGYSRYAAWPWADKYELAALLKD